MKNLRILLTMVLLVAGAWTFGQSTLSLQSADLRVSGTSTLHDWEMKSTKATGKLRADVTSSSVSSIKDLDVTMYVKTLKSGKSGMDDKAYDALKADKYKNATFNLTSATKSGSKWNLKGYFTFAGKKKSVSLNVSESTSRGTVTLKGSYGFKLTDYGITPPKAMLGTIKTGNNVKVNFTVKFK